MDPNAAYGLLLAAAGLAPLLTAPLFLVLAWKTGRFRWAVYVAYPLATMAFGRVLFQLAETDPTDGGPPTGGDMFLGGLAVLTHLALLVAVLAVAGVWIIARSIMKRPKEPMFRATLLP